MRGKLVKALRKQMIKQGLDPKTQKKLYRQWKREFIKYEKENY